MSAPNREAAKADWHFRADLPALEAMLEACRELERRGETINRDNVRELSGVTYTNLLAAGIALYRRMKAIYDQAPSTPLATIEILTVSIERAFRSQSERFDQTLDEGRKAFEAALEEAHLEYRSLSDESEQAKQQNAHLEISLSEAQEREAQALAQAADHAHRASALEGRYRDSLVSRERLRKLLAQRRRRVKRLAESLQRSHHEQQAHFEQARTDLLRQHDRAIDALMVQLDQARTEIKRGSKERQNERVQLEKRLEKLGEELQSAQSDKARFETETHNLKQLNQRQHEKIAALESELAQARAATPGLGELEQAIGQLTRMLATKKKRAPTKPSGTEDD